MTDRELLELAAKAAGIDGTYRDGMFPGIVEAVIGGCDVPWNPLRNDGQALRLAVKLSLLVDCLSHCARPLPDSIEWQEGSGPDACANTRRAIVRAAAELAKQEKP